MSYRTIKKKYRKIKPFSIEGACVLANAVHNQLLLDLSKAKNKKDRELILEKCSYNRLKLFETLNNIYKNNMHR